MEILRTAVLRASSPGLVEVKLDNWRRNMQGDALVIGLAMPVTVGKEGGCTPTVADLEALLGYFLGTFNMAYGRNHDFKPYEGANGSVLRLVSRFLTGREVANDFVGVAQDAGAHVWNARIYLPCSPRLMRSALKKLRRIGWAQGRTIKMEFAEGASFPAGSGEFTRTADADCVITVGVVYKAGPNTWTRIPSYRAINRDALDVTGPDGLTLLAADGNAVHASTDIKKHTLTIGAVELVRQVPPLFAGEAYTRSLDAGATDVTDATTVLYAADPQGNMDELPAGPVRVQLIDQDVATLKLRCIYLPTPTDGEIQEAHAVAAAAEGGPVVGTVPELPEGAAPGAAATAPVEFIPASDSRYRSSPGIVATPDGAMALSIPKVVNAQVGGYVAGHDAQSKEPAARLAQKRVSLRVPGAIGTDGHGRGAALGRQGIRAHFAPLFR